ncbi:MAG: glycosyltransferase family 2 protein [Lachnospiraceae bacterium]|nr:glycosyltransferase family 2 protein [Lachnospiraceae bacterium]
MQNMKLSIIIPCYNERESLPIILEKVKNAPIENKEIIIVEDLSTDGTREFIREEIESQVDRVIYHEKNTGKGGALATGFKAATGDVVIIQDADMEYDPDEYPMVVNPIFEGRAQVVYGSRFMNQRAKGYVLNRLANKGLTFLSNLMTHQKLTDMETCYKAFRREIIQSIEIEEKRFGFEPEITAKIAKRGIKILEVPISYYPRSNAEGKKIGFSDGVRALHCIWHYSR